MKPHCVATSAKSFTRYCVWTLVVCSASERRRSVVLKSLPLSWKNSQGLVESTIQRVSSSVHGPLLEQLLRTTDKDGAPMVGLMPCAGIGHAKDVSAANMQGERSLQDQLQLNHDLLGSLHDDQHNGCLVQAMHDPKPQIFPKIRRCPEIPQEFPLNSYEFH